ncbi:hypothetical protein N8T08_009616 [Aspergillus melleus]|uniref:Uncharacterized protein n=1 Tax=Aspergillus melleus TaxID=138277 RepID=A0ACC3ATI1_9EURO|nr:hypothetical protein N8T08_009616 [Aspergillus melleus]
MRAKWVSGLLFLGLVEARDYSMEGSVIAAVGRALGPPSMESASPHDAGGEDTGLFQAPPWNSHQLPRDDWTVTCDSDHDGNECSRAIDGDNTTYWSSDYNRTANAPPPHSITIDLKITQNVSAVEIWPPQDGGQNGWIARHEVYVSTDGQSWGSAVAYGTWWPDNTVKLAVFEPRAVQYVRFVALSEANGNPWTYIAELEIWAAADIPATPQGQTLGETGVWGPTIDFPIVPVSAAVEPSTGKVLVWSSYRKDQYGGSGGGTTQTSTWDPVSGMVTLREVSETKHDMFCPGISMDMNGRIIVTGGNDDTKTSIYDPFSDAWIRAAPMTMARGYQSSTILSDGNMFVIGGSWSGGEDDNKNGEIYDVGANSWKDLPNAAATPMLTNDRLGAYHADNHGWLFGWKNRSVYQAGPSRAMHWYFVEDEGDVTEAGDRGTDYDQMSGSAVMFDAVNGKILTAGGSHDYEDSDGSRNASIITIGDPNTPGEVVKAGNDMHYDRVFHTSVVLPDGSVFLTGGQIHSLPFVETDPVLTPERYIPSGDQFVEQFPNNIVRVYHSWSVLLPDGTVLNGGGGLCADCAANHYDAQLFTPAYLFDADGNRATRPEITSVTPASLRYGGTITIQADSNISSASLVRYGTTTHTVNTDQRRIELQLNNSGDQTYVAEIPNDPGIALPGYYMLFIFNENGVPSVSKNVQVTL